MQSRHLPPLRNLTNPCGAADTDTTGISPKSHILTPTKAQLVRDWDTKNKFFLKRTSKSYSSFSTAASPNFQHVISKRSTDTGSSTLPSTCNKQSSPPSIKVQVIRSNDTDPVNVSEKNSCSMDEEYVHEDLNAGVDEGDESDDANAPSLAYTVESSTVAPMSIIHPIGTRTCDNSNQTRATKLAENANMDEIQMDMNASSSNVISFKEIQPMLLPLPSNSSSSSDNSEAMPSAPSFSSDEASFISALTFEYHNIDLNNLKSNSNSNSNRNDDIHGDKNSKLNNADNGHQNQAPVPGRGTTYNRNKAIDNNREKTPKKSERLVIIHDKVVDIRKENLSLKEVNLQLMMQLALRKEKDKQDQMNSNRLRAITDKVTQLQSENLNLKKANLDLSRRLIDVMVGSSFSVSDDSNETDKLKVDQIKIDESEEQISELNIQLQEARPDIMHLTDLARIADLEYKNAQYGMVIQSLQARVNEKDISTKNLESHIENMNKEMMNLRRLHNEEKSELYEAYAELKEEATKVVECLKKQISEYQAKQRAAEIAEAKDDSDLESLTNSERETLLSEIQEERDKWLDQFACTPTAANQELLPEAFDDDIVDRGDVGERILCGNSIDGSTLTEGFSAP